MAACEGCGKTLTGRQSRYCSEPCRKRVSRGGEPRVSVESTDYADDSFVFTVMEYLEKADRVHTLDGQHAIALAKLMGGSMMNTSGVAALSKEFRAVMDRAMSGVQVEVDPVDEIKRRRDAKRSAAAG